MNKFLCASLVFLSLTASGRPLETIQHTGEIKVAVDGQTPGFNYFVGKKLTGFEVDLAAEMAMNLGIKLRWITQSFNSLLIGLQADRFDLIATSHAMTPEREKVVDFLMPHYCTGTVIVSRQGGPKTEKDLAGKVVVVPVGTVYYDYLKKNPTLKELRTMPDENAGLQSLTTGKADAWVTEQFVAIEALKSHPKENLQIGATLFTQKNAMVVAKGNPALKEVLNTSLKQILADGRYAHLSQKYFQRDIRCKE